MIDFKKNNAWSFFLFKIYYSIVTVIIITHMNFLKKTTFLFLTFLISSLSNAATYEARYKLESLKDSINEEAKLPEIVAIKFTPSEINEGESSTLSWTVNDAKYFYIKGENSPESKLYSSSAIIRPDSIGNLKYELEAYNFQNKKTSGFGLLEIVAKPELFSFSSDKDTDTVYEGESIVFSWSGKNVFNYKLNNQSVNDNSISIVQNKIGKNKYTLQAYNKLGYTIEMEKEVNVLADPLPSNVSLSIDKSIITESEPVKLSWTGKDVIKYTLQGNGVNNPNVSGNFLTLNPPLGNNEYVLNAYNNKSEFSTDKKTVQVIAKPSINSFISDKLEVTTGDNIILTWSLTNSANAKINNIDVSTLNTKQYSPTTNTTYILDAYNSNQYKVSKSLSVNVIPKAEISQFTASKSIVYKNENIILSWALTGAQSYTLDGESVTGNNKTVSVDKTKTYV